jgi:hypothetical protein
MSEETKARNSNNKYSKNLFFLANLLCADIILGIAIANSWCKEHPPIVAGAHLSTW